MKSRGTSPNSASQITIRVSGKFFQGHLAYLDELIHSAADCRLWPVLNLANLDELDHAAVSYLVEGENRDFNIEVCPGFVRERMDEERARPAA